MSLWSDFWDFVDDTVDDVGDVISDAWDSIKSNPIGTITSVVAMAYGIPPAWAGALGGAAGAAATGGNVVKAAITGGAMGYMGAQAGAAAGSLGPIAQAAAAGTAASVTGAILTGQDVLTAAKSGLILGAVTGGVVELMTPAEAISRVPKQTLAELTSSSADPLGDLINDMGWTDSDSARAAASKAFSQNAATTKTMLQESIPEYVLKAASQTSNPGQYIVNELGWNQGSLTLGAANAAASEYNSPQATKARLLEEQRIQQEQQQKLIEQQQQQVQQEQQTIFDKAQQIADKSGGYLTAQDVIDQNLTVEDVQFYKDYMDNLYKPTEVVGPVQPEVTQPTVQYTDVPGSKWLDQGNGTSIDTRGNIVNTNTGEIIQNGNTTGTYTSVDGLPYHIEDGNFVYGPGQSVDVSNITQEQLNQITQENNPYMNTGSGTQTVSYTPEQEALYNQLRGQGYSPAQATEMITNGSISDAGSGMSVDVSGSPVYSDIAGSGLKGQIPQGYELAPSTDLTGATYNADINAYIRPVSTPPSTPIVPIVVPPTTTTTTTPPTTQPSTPVAPVTVTPPTTVPPTGTGTTGTSNVGGTTAPQPVGGPTTETDSQGNMWYVQLMSDGSVQRDLAWQKPGTTVTNQHVTTPAQPVQPAAPTVVSTSTRTTYDGSVYRDTQMSDGTVTSTLVSGPTGTGSGTGTGTGTTTPPPLTPPTQEVIPPGSSYVAPVETGTTPPTTDTTTTPPTNNGTNYVPMIPPTGQPTTPTEDETRGRYTLGEPIRPNIPNTLNPGWITNVPDYYTTTNNAQSKYYWGGHPYQTGTTFNRQLYNQAPGAPAQAWGQGYAQTSATPQQIMQAMGNYTPYYIGPVKP